MASIDTALDDLLVALAATVDASAQALVIEDGALVVRGSTADLRGAPPDDVAALARQVLTTGRAVRGNGAGSILVLPVNGPDDAQPRGVVVLRSERPGWFDDADEERATAALAAAGESAVDALRNDPLRIPAQPVSPPAYEQRPARPPAGLALWQWAPGSTTCSWSRPLGHMLGLRANEPVTLDWVREHLHPDDLPVFDDAADRLGRGKGAAGVLRLRTQRGRYAELFVWGEGRRAEDGTLAGAWGALIDITADQRDAALLRGSLAGLRAAQELTGLGIWEWHPETGQLWWSPQMYALAGRSAGGPQPTLADWHEQIHPDDVERARTLEAGEATPETFRVVGEDGVTRHVRAWSHRAVAASGGVAICGAALDVTRDVDHEILVAQRVGSDAVTGLANRPALDRHLRAGLAAGEVALMVLDLDRFGLVNETVGHQAGDGVLRGVAGRLRDVVPAGSVIARIGGDEFAVVPPAGLDWAGVRELAEAILETLRVPAAPPGSLESVACRASLGATLASGSSVDDLLRGAHLALAAAKSAGRDRAVLYDDELRSRADGRAATVGRLRRALAEARLVLQYQPVVTFTNGRVVGAEALLHLSDGDRLLGPEDFIEIAEETGLVVDLDGWVIEAVVAQLADWREGPGRVDSVPWVSINLSARSVRQPAVSRRLLDAVAAGRVPAELIKIELVERTLDDAGPAASSALSELIGAGVALGIDDFGTGSSALGHLQQLELDFLKIDRGYVAQVGQNERADAVVSAIVDLAHAHGLQAIAEGVETPRQARRLREIGCDLAQGYHFGRPGDASRVVR